MQKPFEFPTIWNKFILDCNDPENLKDAAFMLHQAIAALNTIQSIADGTKLFKSADSDYRHKCEFMDYDDPHHGEYIDAILDELFTMGVAFQHTCEFRSIMTKDKFGRYELRSERVGRYSEWCWIDQKDTFTGWASQPRLMLPTLLKRQENR